MSDSIVSDSEWRHHPQPRKTPAITKDKDFAEVADDLDMVSEQNGYLEVHMAVPTRRLPEILMRMYADMDEEVFDKFSFKRAPWSTEIAVRVRNEDVAVGVVDFLLECRGWCRVCGDPSCVRGYAFTNTSIKHRDEFEGRPEQRFQSYDPSEDDSLNLEALTND